MAITIGTTSKHFFHKRTDKVKVNESLNRNENKQHTQLVQITIVSHPFDALFAPTGPVQNDLHFLLLERLASPSDFTNSRKENW